MEDASFFQKLFRLSHPWVVDKVILSPDAVDVKVVIKAPHGDGLPCPICGKKCDVHDHRKRSWQHLPTCQARTIIEASIPRVKCKDHGVHQIPVPWADGRSDFTTLFEECVLSWLKATTIAAVARELDITWDQVDGVMERAVKRGLARREVRTITNLSIDETSMMEGHDYVTVLTDGDSGLVTDVLLDRKKETVVTWITEQKPESLAAIETVSMDMCPAFIYAFLENLDDAKCKICFDRFHVAGYFGEGVKTVRKDEHKALMREFGESPLSGTLYDFLQNSENTDNRTRRGFLALTRSSLKTARAWAIKEQAGKLWGFTMRAWAEKGWLRLVGWTDRCQLPAMKTVGRTVKKHLWGILNAVVHHITNAIAESVNAKIQKVKAMACGFRNRSRFRLAILFHFGGLDMSFDQAAKP